MKSRPRPLLGVLTSAFVRHGNRTRVEKAIIPLLKGSNLINLTPATPAVYLRSKRKAGIVYKLPVPLGDNSARSYALRWLRAAVRTRPERGFPSRLLAELKDLQNRRGETSRRRELVHQTALLNRGFLRLLRR